MIDATLRGEIAIETAAALTQLVVSAMRTIQGDGADDSAEDFAARVRRFVHDASAVMDYDKPTPN